MYIIENKIEIPCGVQQLFDYVTQPWLWHEWHPNSKSATKSQTALKVGDSFQEMIRLKPLDPIPVIFNKKTEYKVLVSEQNSQWIVEGQTDNGRLIIQYDFEALSDHRVLFKRKLSFEVSGFYRFLASFLVKNMKQMSVVALDNLKAKF